MKNQSLSLLERLQDNNYALYFAIFTCVAIAPNSYYMFHEFSLIPTDYFAREIQAAAVAILLAGSILYYTAKKNLDYASKFANFEFFISCCYYFHSLIMKDGQMVWNWHIIPAVAFAYMLPWSVKGYAGTIDYNQIPKNIKPEPIAFTAEQITPVFSPEEMEMFRSLIKPQSDKEPEPLNLDNKSTEELLEIIENDDLEDVFGKGSISAIKD